MPFAVRTAAHQVHGPEEVRAVRRARACLVAGEFVRDRRDNAVEIFQTGRNRHEVGQVFRGDLNRDKNAVVTSHDEALRDSWRRAHLCDWITDYHAEPGCAAEVWNHLELTLWIDADLLDHRSRTANMQKVPISGPAARMAMAAANEPLAANTTPTMLGTITLPSCQRALIMPVAVAVKRISTLAVIMAASSGLYTTAVNPKTGAASRNPPLVCIIPNTISIAENARRS